MNFLALGIAAAALASTDSGLVPVRVEFVEALAPRDTTSSVRYQQSYEGTISVAKTLLEKKLAACGYTLDTRTAFYDASDALKAKELGAKAAVDGAWLIVAPRRSNHYLLLVQGAEAVPTASIMASADKVGELGSRHRTLSPINSKMAAIAAKEARARTKRKARYVSIVSADCANCVDFSKSFDRAAEKLALAKALEIPITGEAFKVDELREKVNAAKPDFVLLPNYSKVASIVMAAFNSDVKPPLFVGGDGWGDAQYGFVQNGLDVQKVRGITVRGFPPVATGLEKFPLGRSVSKKASSLGFAPDLSILKILDESAKALCAKRPKNKEEFRAAFEGKFGDGLKAPWGVSVFELKKGEIKFAKTIQEPK